MTNPSTTICQIMLINMGGKGNIGDRAMALNVVRHFRMRFPAARILVGPHTPDFMIEEFSLTRYPFLSHCLSRFSFLREKLSKSSWTATLFNSIYFSITIFIIFTLILIRRYLGINIRAWSAEFELADAISDSNVIFFCGGGYINDVGKFDSQTNLLMALLGIIARRPVIMSGQGLGPFNTKTSKWLLKLVIPRLNLITFRDVSGSKYITDSLSIKLPAGSRSCGDDAMSLPIKEKTVEHEVWHGKVLGVNFRISPFTADLDKKIDAFAEYLNKISEIPDWRIEFFIFETWRTWEHNVLNDLLKKSRIKNYLIHKTEDPREALFLVNRCTITIGISYHFVIFSLKLGIPCMALYSGTYYKAKMLGLLQWYQKESWAIATDSLIVKDMIDKTIELSNISNIERKNLISITKEQASACEITINQASQLIFAG